MPTETEPKPEQNPPEPAPAPFPTWGSGWKVGDPRKLNEDLPPVG